MNFLNNTTKKYLLEFVIIFSGISGSFLVDEYREDLEINRQISKSLLAIKSELLDDERNKQIGLSFLGRCMARHKK